MAWTNPQRISQTNKGDEMTDTKPEALRLAEDIATEAVLEIRRLHEVNQELLKALKVLGIAAQRMGHSSLTNPIYQAQAVIDKAEGSK